MTVHEVTASCKLTLLSFLLPAIRIPVRFIKIRMLVLQPLYELLYLFILEYSFDRMIIPFQLSLREYRMYLVMTDAVKIDRFFSFECPGNKMVLVMIVSQRALAQRADIFSCVLLHVESNAYFSPLNLGRIMLTQNNSSWPSVRGLVNASRLYS